METMVHRLEVVPVSKGWQLNGTNGVRLLQDPAKERLLEISSRIAARIAPARIVVRGIDGAIERQIEF